MYKRILRPLLFSLDSEAAHHVALRLAAVARLGVVESMLKRIYDFEDSRLAVDAFGIKFKNPVGLAAGFDKDCVALELISALGFGASELGTVTATPQSGNPRPRIFRLQSDEALINRMGFPSSGAEKIATNIRRAKLKQRAIRIGINIGKSKVVPIELAHQDYVSSFKKLAELGDYYVVNVSSPNTPELRSLQQKEKLAELFAALQGANIQGKPILVKIAPDLDFSQIDDIIECCMQHRIAGVVAVNTTFSRSGLTAAIDESGGMSGRPLFQRAREVVAYLSRSTGGKLPIIGVGGIFSAEDALSMVEAGASLIQVYTALVYEGPNLAYKIKRGLCALLDARGAKSLTEMIATRNHA